MSDQVIWAQTLEHAGAADIVGDAICKAVAEHPAAIMSLHVDAVSDICCVAVVGDADDPEDPTFWSVWLFDEPKAVGDEV